MEIYPIIICMILGLNALGSSNAAEITCELKEIKYGIKAIQPEGKTFFRAGETVQIICSETYRIFLTKEGTQTFKCQNDGQWDRNPTCEEIRCEVPRDSRLYYPSYYFYGNMKLDVTKSYSCLSGYRQMADVATCTRDGWKPDPLCADITCEAPNIPNAQIVNREHTNYNINSRIKYRCHPRFEPKHLIEITCNSAGTWINIQNCVVKAVSCTTPILENGYIDRDPPTEDTIFYSCNTGYKPLTGKWWGAATCINGRWSNEPRCILDEEGCVSPPKVENAVIISKPQEWYSYGSHVIYRCQRHFTIKGNSRVSCLNTAWDEAPTCEGKAQCTKPTKNLQYVTLLDEKNLFNNFETLRYKCNKPYDKIPGGTLTCRDEKWIPTIYCTSSICPPPPEIEDGDFDINVKNGEVITDVKYSCQIGFVLKEPRKHHRCRDGIWETPPKCLKPCIPTPEIYMDSNIRPIQDHYVKHSDREISFRCKEGWNAGGFSRSDDVKGTCSDGKMTIHQKCNTKNWIN